MSLIEHFKNKKEQHLDDIIIVVDDDMIYSKNIVKAHELLHSIYQCDVGAIDQDDVVKEWFPIRFYESQEIFSDRFKCNMYGWLSFSVRLRAFLEFKNFFDDIVEEFPEARFHDDAIFSFYAKFKKLYVSNICSSPLGSIARTKNAEDDDHALRLIQISNWSIRQDIEKKISKFISSKSETEIETSNSAQFCINDTITPRPLHICDGLLITSQTPGLSIIAHWIADTQAILTFTVFDEALIGSRHQINMEIEGDAMSLTITFSSQKFSVIAESNSSIFRPVSSHQHNLQILQTDNSSIVTKKNFMQPA